jgi:hypothetical protein
MATNDEPVILRGWKFSRRERTWLWVSLFLVLAFGANLEKRTALRRVPMTDLGVPVCAAGAVLKGDNLYRMSEWHNWHYNYPPTLAILLTPLALSAPSPPPVLNPGVPRVESNTPWGYDIASHRHYYGLHRDNAHFFGIIAVWYFLNIALIALSAHALACALEGCRLREPPPIEPRRRRRWWALRALPLLVCAGSLGTDLSRGQMDVLMLAAMAFGLYAAAMRREFQAGLWLCFPATVKLFPALLFLYPAWRLRWRTLLGITAGLVLALTIIPVVAFGPTRTIEYYQTWMKVVARPGLGQGGDPSRAAELTAMGGTDNQSLLAFIYNWRYHGERRDQRPPEALATDRWAVYGIGALLFVGVFVAMGMRRQDTPRNLLISAGLLMGLALVISPVTHNYYFLLLLPLIAALVDFSAGDGTSRGANRKLLLLMSVFTVTDLLARLPGIGPWLRNAGVPFLTMAAMLVAGAWVLMGEWPKERLFAIERDAGMA